MTYPVSSTKRMKSALVTAVASTSNRETVTMWTGPSPSAHLLSPRASPIENVCDGTRHCSMA